MNARHLLIGAACLMATACAVRAEEPERRTALETKASGTKTFYADARAGNNQVSFFSESTLEDFTGVCNQVGGQCQFDPQHLESFSGKFQIALKDVSTGIALRDQHMRSADWLDAKQHPQIILEIEKVEKVKKTAPAAASMMLVGKLDLHGVRKPIQIPATLRYLDESPQTMRRVKGDLIRIRAKFSLSLADYGVKGPQGSDIIGLKVSDNIDLKVTVFGSTEVPPDPLKADTTGNGKRTPPKRKPPRRK